MTAGTITQDLHQLFRERTDKSRLTLEAERELIAQAQAEAPYSAAAQWDLLRQYRGALQAASFKVRSRIRGMSAEQIQDLEGDLVLEALEAIREFDLVKHIRLGQTLPKRLNRLVTNRQQALTVPARVLSRWSHILQQCGGDHATAAREAPKWQMSTETFRAIQASLDFSDEEWTALPYSAERVVPDTTTHALAHAALAKLTDAEREVMELAYGFRGDPKSDAEVAEIIQEPMRTVQARRVRALEKLRTAR